MSDSINISIFLLENSNKSLFKEYVFSLDKKIIDIKNTVLSDLKKSSKNDTINDTTIDTISEYNYIDLDNITEKIYKDFGKLSFDKGILPFTYDNYKLSAFTVNDRTFHFIAIPKVNTVTLPEIKQPSFLKKVIKEQYKQSNENNRNNKNKNDFVLDNNDFPPLK